LGVLFRIEIHFVEMTAPISKSNSVSRDFYCQQFATSGVLRGISNTEALSLPASEPTSMSHMNYQKSFSSKIEIGIKENKNPAAVQTRNKDSGWNVSNPIWRELRGTPIMSETLGGAGLSARALAFTLGAKHGI